MPVKIDVRNTANNDKLAKVGLEGGPIVEAMRGEGYHGARRCSPKEDTSGATTRCL